MRVRDSAPEVWEKLSAYSIFHKLIKKSSFYLLRERPETYNEFYVCCVYYTKNTFQKKSLETYLYIAFLRNHIYSFTKDEFTNVPT